ncbi:heme ABC exporter ATP-binding protein CcmA [Verrucomicrobiota bacterium sgz303538]
MIEVRNLSKAYGNQEVLHGLSFMARPGEITLLLGANGVGKTTTLRILAGLLRPDFGDALIGSQSIVRNRVAAQRNLSYLPQDVTFHPRLHCESVLQFYADLRGISRDVVPKLLERVGLVESARKQSTQLSGGLRQRLGLAVLLLPDAPVLLLDEPGVSLDPDWRLRLQEQLQEEAARGKTVLVTTHLLAEWEGVAHRSLLCERGKVVEVDPFRLREEFSRSQTIPQKS